MSLVCSKHYTMTVAAWNPNSPAPFLHTDQNAATLFSCLGYAGFSGSMSLFDPTLNIWEYVATGFLPGFAPVLQWDPGYPGSLGWKLILIGFFGVFWSKANISTPIGAYSFIGPAFAGCGCPPFPTVTISL